MDERTAKPTVDDRFAPARTWAPEVLLLTVVAGLTSKLVGVVVAPGLRGVAVQTTVDRAETVAATLGYVFAAFLIALICAGSFELARTSRVPLVQRGFIVAFSGLTIAIASPAFVDRLYPTALIANALVVGLVAVVSASVALRSPRTRAVGFVLLLLALSALARPSTWILVRLAGERASMAFYETGRGFGIASVVLQTAAVVVAAIWLATRAPWRGRLLVNVLFVAAFAVTYAIADKIDAPSSAFVAVLRGSLLQSAGTTLAFDAATVAIFVTLASLLLTGAALVQRRSRAVAHVLGLALLSAGAFDVPLQALAVTAAAQWVLVAGAWSDDESDLASS